MRSSSDLKSMMDEFLLSRLSAKPSPHTVDAYRRDLEGLAHRLPCAKRRFFSEIDVSELTKAELRSGFASWAGDHAKTSVIRGWSTWNSFFAYMVSEDLFEGNPMSGIRKPRRPKSSVKVIRGDNVTGKLLSTARQIDQRARRTWPERDVAIIAVLAVTGLRLAEVVGLRVSSMDGPADARRLTVTGKGDKSRTVPIYPALESVIAAYLASRAERFPKQRLAVERPNTILFVDHDGLAITERKVQYLVRNLYERAGISAQVPQGALVHALRHTFATAALEGGANVLEVSQLLGHESLDTTRRYLEATAQELRGAVISHPAQVAIENFVSDSQR